MLVGSDRSVAAILPPGCMLLAKNFTTPTTPTLVGVDLRQARDRFQKFSELLHPKVAVAKALSRVLKNFNKSPKKTCLYISFGKFFCCFIISSFCSLHHFLVFLFNGLKLNTTVTIFIWACLCVATSQVPETAPFQDPSFVQVEEEPKEREVTIDAEARKFLARRRD